MKFFDKLFGRCESVALAPRQNVFGKLEIDEFGHGLVSIHAIDFIGRQAKSPDGRYRLIWADRSPDRRHGGYRESGHGTWSLLRDDHIVVSGKLERPQDGKVADNGTSILHDWMFGQGLQGRFVAFAHDGRTLIEKQVAANLMSNSLSADGRFAICQTANAPGSPDSCHYILFDIEGGQGMARWEVETGWAETYTWDLDKGCVYLCTKDGESVAYDFAGRMVDREAWESRRIALGDLPVIQSVIMANDKLEDALRAAVMEGLAVAASGGEIWSQARALRQLGELHEREGELAEAIAAYDSALAIDPKIGVARKVEQLRKRADHPSGKGPAVKSNRFERQAECLGIGHEIVWLEKGDGKTWRLNGAQSWASVEPAALSHYHAQGWSGAASEGGLVLTLIKAASFRRLQTRNADTFIEALYAQNVSFAEDRFDPGELVATVRKATIAQIEANWNVIAASAGRSPAYYPAVRRDHVLGLFEALGAERLAEVATVFATAPYDLRSGWPDLTLWKEGAVRFVEVKAPSDSFHATQARLISKLLKPLGLDVALAEVRSKT